MRLLLVARRFPPDVRSGTETVFEHLLEEARASGHEVRLVAGFHRDRALLPAGTVAVDLRGRGAAAWVALPMAAAAEARRFKPDAVLSNSIEVRVPGVPTVTLVHDLNFGGAGTGPGARARRLFYRGQAAGLSRVVAVSEATRSALLTLGIAPAKVVTIHNGVDLDRFSPAPRPPDSDVRVVQVSRILPGKGQHCTVDAVGRMRPDQRQGLSVDIVGSVSDRIYADQVGLQAWNLPISFHFDVPDVAPFYQRADLAVFPTRMPEGFGYAAVEAMACGLPVVAFSDPAVIEATGGLAITVPRDDIPALRDAILGLARDAAERRRLGDAGRAWVQRYRWEGVWLAYERVLAGVVRDAQR